VIQFQGRVAIVTGSGRGLGASYVRLLSERGASVVVHDAGVSLEGSGSDPAVADALVQEIAKAGREALPCYENIESRAGCTNLVNFAMERFGRVDILVHNAGLRKYATIEETEQTLLDHMVGINVYAPFWLSQLVIPIMKKEKYGRIVFTTSGVGMDPERSMPGLSSYALGKMAQLGLMNALATELQGTGICVNAISPVAATRMYSGPYEKGELTPEQVAPGVAFLCSSECNFSGIVLRARNGQFSVSKWASRKWIDFGSKPTPEQLAERWSEIVAD
jgi:NAD(P)-dependent dehydrogenase (short-subunit alcohol dehydrogenase family)